MPAIIPTPAASNAQTRSNGVAVAWRPTVALEELRRRLEAELPGYLEEENDAQGFEGNRRMFPFDQFRIAPDDLTTQHANSVIVAISSDMDFESQGSRGFRGEGEIIVYLTNVPVRDENQILSIMDRAASVRLLLQNYLTDCYDPKGRLAWKTLAPKYERALPEPLRKYGGVSLHYRLVQPAGSNLWAVSP